MKRILLVLGAVAVMAMGQAAQAATIPFGDSTIHWAGYAQPASDGPWMNSVDAIGAPQFTGGVATTTGAFLTGISFLDNPSYHAAEAYNPFFSMGDLFIDVNADKTWDFVVKSDLQSKAAKLVNIYNITSLGITTDPSDTAYYKKGYVRRNQPVALLASVTAPLTKLGTVGYSGFYDAALKSYSVKFNLGNYIDLNNNDFIVGFSADCGNEVILEKVPVPEPGTMVLFGAGLMGLVIYSKRRMGKSA